MTTNMDKKVMNRIKSFAWRLSVMIVVALVNYVTANYTGFGLSPEMTVLIGLVAGEISKFLNTELNGKEIVEFTAKKTSRKK